MRLNPLRVSLAFYVLSFAAAIPLPTRNCHSESTITNLHPRGIPYVPSRRWSPYSRPFCQGKRGAPTISFVQAPKHFAGPKVEFSGTAQAMPAPLQQWLKSDICRFHYELTTEPADLKDPRRCAGLAVVKEGWQAQGEHMKQIMVHHYVSPEDRTPLGTSRCFMGVSAFGSFHDGIGRPHLWQRQ
jgi:hypothetical protein